MQILRQGLLHEGFQVQLRTQIPVFAGNRRVKDVSKYGRDATLAVVVVARKVVLACCHEA